MDNVQTAMIGISANLRYEPIRPHHAEVLFQGLSDVDGYRFIPDDPPQDVEVLRARYDRLQSPSLSDDRQELWLNWAIVEKEESKYLGYIQATVNINKRTSLIAYHLFPNVWGRGIATESVTWLADELLSNYGIVSIMAYVDTRNSRSIALMERLGFRRKKIINDADFFKGDYSSEIVFQLNLEISN